jgi:alpha-glucosidase
MPRFLHPAAIALLVAWAPFTGAAAAESASSPAAMSSDRTALAAFSFTGFTRNDSHVIVATDGAPRLRVDLCQPGIARIWVDPTGRFEKPASFGVANETWTGVPFQVSEALDYLRIQTSELTVRVWKKPLRVTFHTADDGAQIAGERIGEGMGWFRTGAVFMTADLAADEHLYGLGESNDARLGAMDRRGTTRDMFTGQTLTRGCVTADFPVTFFLSTDPQGRGYGFYLDNTYRTEFDLGKARTDAWSFRANGGELVFYFIAGPRLNTVLDRYTWLTGRPPLPPLWSLGYIQSKCTYTSWDALDDTLRQLRGRGFPLDALVIDYDWAEEINNFKWHPRWEGRSPAMLAAHRAQGVRYLLSNSGPMIKKSASNHASGVAAGVFATDGEGNTVTCGHYGGDLLDFTAPNIKDWLWPQLRPLAEAGIGGWWLDLVEPEGEPAQTVYRGGDRARIHNTFALLNARAYWEMLMAYDPDSRPFLLSRTGTAGIRKYGVAVWSGDVFSDYITLQAHCPEALNAAMSGLDLWSSDTGGFIAGLFRDSAADHGLLYQRWMQFSCFNPITRAHKSGPSEPYRWGDAVEQGCRESLRLRYRLLPYIYSYFREAAQNGQPLMKAMVLEYQDDPAVFDLKDQYLFGRELLVAPVLTEATGERSVYFPAGAWIDWHTGHEFRGPARRVVSAPQDRIPLFVKSGAIIPMAPFMSHTGEEPWDPITLSVWPEGTTRFHLYRDDGATLAYRKRDEFTETLIECREDAGRSVALDIAESNKRFTPGTYALEFHLRSNPKAVTVDGRALTLHPLRSQLADATEGAFWDETGRCLHAKFRTSPATRYAVAVALDGSTLARPTAPDLAAEARAAATAPAATKAAPKLPFFLPAPTIPCRVQAENFDRGGEGIGFHKTAPGKIASSYRDEPVDLEDSGDAGGGLAVTGGASGDWLDYTVNVPAAGYYDLGLRLSSARDDGFIYVGCGGKEIAAVSVPQTGGRRAWRTVWARGIYFEKGEQPLNFYVMRGGFAFNFFDLEPSALK